MIQSQNFESGLNYPPVNLCLQEAVYRLFEQYYAKVILGAEVLVSLLLVVPTVAHQCVEGLDQQVLPVHVLRGAFLHFGQF